MKKIIKLIIAVVILGLIGFGIYKFFFDCEKYNTDFDRNFKLTGFDYAVVGDELTVKLVKIEDDRCLEEDCERKGQFLVKFLVKDDRHVAYETLGSLSESAKDLTDHKLDYRIELVETDGKTAEFKVTKLEHKKKY